MRAQAVLTFVAVMSSGSADRRRRPRPRNPSRHGRRGDHGAGIGRSGRVIHADSFGGTGRAWIDGEVVEVAALRGGPLGCGDLVPVVGTREEVRVVDVEWQGEMLPSSRRRGRPAATR